MSGLKAKIQAAMAHIAAGRLHQAEAISRRILAAKSDDAGALAGLGTLAFEVRQNDEAMRLYERALDIDGGAAGIRLS